MIPDINDYEVLSDTPSSTSSRHTSSISSHMASNNVRLRRTSVMGRQSSVIDLHENKQPKLQTPVKVLVVNGKCSEIFKSALEDCVEECILEFDGENSVYVQKPGQTIQLPAGSRQSSIVSIKDIPTNIAASAKSNRRKSSTNSHNLPLINGTRSSLTSNYSMPITALAAANAARMRQQLSQPKFSFAENISEESTDIQTVTEQSQTVVATDVGSDYRRLSQDTLARHSNTDSLSRSTSSSNQKGSTNPSYLSYRDRHKDYRLSDLVMLGPEYFADVFNLPRKPRNTTRALSTQRTNNQQQGKTIDNKASELDRIKQDLFHRYLWTRKPQVSCRILPITSFTRTTTFVI